MDYKDFMESYLKRITDIKNIPDLINESKCNHRVQKIIIPYILKDQETLNKIVELSKTDKQANKLLNDAILTITKLSNGEMFNFLEMKELSYSLLDRVKNISSNMINNVSNINNLDFIGYAKMFNDYLVECRISSLDTITRKKIDIKMESIDFDNLII